MFNYNKYKIFYFFPIILLLIFFIPLTICQLIDQSDLSAANDLVKDDLVGFADELKNDHKQNKFDEKIKGDDCDVAYEFNDDVEKILGNNNNKAHFVKILRHDAFPDYQIRLKEPK